jgi:hypothetical protein
VYSAVLMEEVMTAIMECNAVEWTVAVFLGLPYAYMLASRLQGMVPSHSASRKEVWKRERSLQ